MTNEEEKAMQDDFQWAADEAEREQKDVKRWMFAVLIVAIIFFGVELWMT